MKFRQLTEHMMAPLMPVPAWIHQAFERSRIPVYCRILDIWVWNSGRTLPSDNTFANFPSYDMPILEYHRLKIVDRHSYCHTFPVWCKALLTYRSSTMGMDERRRALVKRSRKNFAIPPTWQSGCRFWRCIAKRMIERNLPYKWNWKRLDILCWSRWFLLWRFVSLERLSISPGYGRSMAIRRDCSTLISPKFESVKNRVSTYQPMSASNGWLNSIINPCSLSFLECVILISRKRLTRRARKYVWNDASINPSPVSMK